METGKKGIIIKSLMIAALLLIIPMTVTAMGSSEVPYGITLDEEFAAIAEALEAGDIDLQTAIDQLHELRTENGRDDNEDYQKMEGLLKSVQDGTITQTRAQERLRLLDESKTELSEVQLQERLKSKNEVKVQAEDSAGSNVQTGKPETSGSTSADKPEAAGEGMAGKN